jgi:xanthine dehydrogenase accessory factor
MKPFDVLAAAQRLQQQDQPFALVTVLRVQAPASARPGDKAVVTAEGIQEGWIGGGCAQPAVLRTVRQALADGRARVVRIAPAAAGDPGTSAAASDSRSGEMASGGPLAAEGEMRQLEDILEFGMACHSGGTLELFVDPMLPTARLTVIGDSPLAVALAGLAPRVGLPVTVLAHGADASRFADAERVIASDHAAEAQAAVAPGSFVIVATQGRRDLQGLIAALALQPRRVFFVASARKAQVLKAALVESGQDAAAVAAIVAPAGQAIGAQTPPEIALSVLAAVVAARRGQAESIGMATAAVAPQAPKVKPLPLPESAPIVGSCCGAAAPVQSAAIPTAAASPVPVGGSSCCGG